MQVFNFVRPFTGILSQLLVTVVATLSVISDGMQYGWTAPVLPILRSENSPVKISRTDEVWLETIYLFSGLLGLPITMNLVDRIGRKKSLLISSSMSLLAWIIIAFANRVEFLYLARILTGAAANVGYVATPMYISEIAKENIRGFLVGYDYLMMALGTLVIYSVAPFVPYYVPSIIGSCLIVTQLITLPFMPSSPYFLLYVDRKDEARKSLQRLRGCENDNDNELEDIAKAVQRQKEEKGRPRDLFLVDSNRKAILIVTILIASQHYSGYSVLAMNLHTIVIESGSVFMSSELVGIISSALTVIATAICSLCVDRFGRKIFLALSSILTGLCLLAISIYFTYKYSGADVKSVSWIPTAAVLIFAVVFKLGLGFLPQVLFAELFSSKIKLLGMAVGDAMFIIFGFTSLLFYNYLVDGFGIDVPLYFFAAVSFVSAVYTVLFVPETKGKTLEEIQMMLKMK